MAEIIDTPIRALLYGTRDAIAVLTAATVQDHYDSEAQETADEQVWHAISRLEDDLSAITRALAASDEPRPWTLYEGAEGYDEIMAASAAEALDQARGNVDRDNYPIDDEDGPGGTIWIDVRVSCAETGEAAEDTIRLDEPEPACEAGHDHDWQSPYEVVGGCQSNPGVWGHGGGVIIREVCRHCGAYCITDTWAQRMDTGEQGLVVVRYEAADDDSLTWRGTPTR